MFLLTPMATQLILVSLIKQFSDKAIEKNDILSLRCFAWTVQHLQTQCVPATHSNKQFSAFSQTTVLPLYSLGKHRKKSYLFKVLKCWPAGNSLLIDSLGSERHHKLPQITCISKTLFAEFKKRGQIRTIRSQEVLKETCRNAAAKLPWSCQCDLLLLGGLVLTSLCTQNMLWHHSFQGQTEKDGGVAVGLGTLAVYMETAVLGSGSIGPPYGCFPNSLLWQ